MKANNSLTAVVVGTDHQNTLGVIRSLGEAGIRVKAVLLSDSECCSTAHSKYIDDVYLVRYHELISTLTEIGNQIGERVPLFPCGDDTAVPISHAYDQLHSLYYLPSAGNGDNMLRLMNKKEMLKAACSAGLLVPNWVCLIREEFEEMAQRCKSLSFPCILKPVGLLPNGVFRFHILWTMEELLNCTEYLAENCTGAIVQEYVTKTEEFGVNGCRLYHSGKTVFGGIIRKKRFSQCSLGSTTARTIQRDENGLCDAARRFVESIDYRGIFDMEFITDGSDFYFVEMNFRNGGYGYAYTRAGRNFPAIWAKEACGFSVNQELSRPLKQLFFINESADLQNVRAGEISVVRWLIDVLRAKAHMYVNFRDMRPMLKKIMRK